MAFNFKNNVKVTKDVGWLIPGLEVKRWFFLIFLGSIMIVLGFMVLANVRPIYLTLELIRKAALILPSNFLPTRIKTAARKLSRINFAV